MIRQLAFRAALLVATAILVGLPIVATFGPLVRAAWKAWSRA